MRPTARTSWSFFLAALLAASPLLADTPTDHGTVTGLVLDDNKGLPLPGANVSIGTSPVVVTGENGRYILAGSGASLVLVVSKPGMTTVERTVAFVAGANVIPVDARLTELATPTPVGSDGATLQSGPISVVVPAGAVGATVPCQLTSLSAQGLPALLPLGWSPLAAFDLRVAGVAMPVTASVSGLPAGTVYLATYDKTQHAWTLAGAGTITAGADDIVVPASGSYAIVVPDSGTVVPTIGGPLPAAQPAAVPLTSSVSSDVNPPSLIGWDTALVTLGIQSPAELPSGTVLAVDTAESFTLTSGATGATEQHRFDIVMYRNPVVGTPSGGNLSGAIRVAPERDLADPEYARGELTLEIKAGRESVRGRVSSGGAEQVDSKETHLMISAGAVPAGTSITLEQAAALSSFLPSSATLVPVAEFTVDFAGQTLASAAQLSVQIGTLSPSDTLLLARVERYQGIPYLAVVSRAAVDGDSVVSVPTPGLPGIVVGGRYVVYRSTAPIGFVAGTTSSSNGSVQALVRGSNLPFIGLAQTNGSYVMAALGGAVTVTASVPGLATASGSVNVVANQTVTLDLTLGGQSTTATVTPINGATLVPVSTQVTINSPVAFKGSTVTAQNIKLMQVVTATEVLFRLQLSGNGKSVAVLPNALLALSTAYSLQVTGLKDVNGSTVLVPATTFTTKGDARLVFDLNALTFSLPDANGLVTMSAPAASFAPSTTILVINTVNGGVVSATVGNEGQVAPLPFPAAIGDTLMVTITDPLGTTTTYKRTEFVAPDGRTGIGAAGGVVRGADGQELRIPSGALAKGIIFKLVTYTAPPNDPKPAGFAVPGAYLGSGLKITASEPVTFESEVELAFTVPALPAGTTTVTEANGTVRPATLKDAFYYVVERTTTADGTVLYKVVDHAFVEGEGADARVVTASPPFPGYLDVSGAIDNMANNITMMWATFDELMPGKALFKAIRGKVVRPEFAPGTTVLTSQGVEGIQVVATDGSGAALTAMNGGLYATSQKDGTFMLWDAAATGGQYKVTALPSADTPEASATLHDANPADTKMPGLRFYRAELNANITLPAKVPPVPPADVDIHVYTKNADGTRGAEVNGFVTEDTPLFVGLRLKRDAAGQPIGQLQSLTVTTRGSTEALGLLLGNYVPLDGMAEYTPSTVGVYRLTAAVLSSVGASVPFTSTFSVIAAGGSNTQGLPDDAPSVVDAQTVPKRNAVGVPVNVFLQVAFTEPVKNVPGNVRLKTHAGDNVPFKLSAIGVDAQGNVTPIETLASAQQAVTGLTIQPLAGLDYTATYRLALADAIVDTDVTPKALAAYETSFSTFNPAALTEPGSGDLTASAGIAVLGDRAYLTSAPINQLGSIHAFDISDPTKPTPLQQNDRPDLATDDSEKPLNKFQGRPMDIVADNDDGKVLPHEGGRYVVVPTGPWTQSVPSNLNIFDTSIETGEGVQTKWRGGVSLTSNSVDGTAMRVAVKNGIAYAATNRKGIQMVDLGEVVKKWPANWRSSEWMTQWTRLNTVGQGFATELVNTIPLPCANPTPLPCQPRTTYWFSGIKVGDYPAGRRVIAVGGDPVNPAGALVIADPLAQQLGLFEVQTSISVGEPPQLQAMRISMGTALALGVLRDRNVAVVVGTGRDASGASVVLLAVVGLTPAAEGGLTVTTLGMTALPSDVDGIDVVLHGEQAIVSSKTFSTVVDLSLVPGGGAPRVIGRIDSLGGRLAAAGPQIFGSAALSFGYTGTDVDKLAGVRTATLERMLLVRPCVRSADGRECVSSATIPFNQDKKTTVPVEIGYKILGGDAAETIDVRIFENVAPMQTLEAPFDGRQGTTSWAEGVTIKPTARYFVQARANAGTSEELASRMVVLGVSDIDVTIEKDRQLLAAAPNDGTTLIKNTWDETGNGLEPPVNGYDYKNSTRTFTKAIATNGQMAPQLPDDYVILKINASGALVWDDTGNDRLRVNVPNDTGRVTAKLKATKALADMTIQKIQITAQYFEDTKTATPLRLKEDEIIIMNERLHGWLYDTGAAALGRGEGLDGAVVELSVGMIPFAGDVAGLTGEVINAFDPATDVSKLNFTLSIVGFASEFGQITGPPGIALDKGLVFIRVGFKRIGAVASGPLSRLSNVLYIAVKARDWGRIAEFAEGTMKLAFASGALVKRIALTDIDMELLNRFIKRHSNDVTDTRFVEKLVTWDEVYANPEAVRGAVRALADFKDEAGDMVRLSDDAAQGAVRFMAQAGNGLNAAEREVLLKSLLTNGADAEVVLKYVKNSASPQAVEGMAKLMRNVPCPVQ